MQDVSRGTQTTQWNNHATVPGILLTKLKMRKFSHLTSANLVGVPRGTWPGVRNFENRN
jgi:hypothetical protein